MKVFLVLLAVVAVVVSGFQQTLPQSVKTNRQDVVVLRMGLFDGFIKSMESGYAGGDESQYSQMKAAEEAKRAAIQKKKTEERKQRGWSNFKDYNPKTQKTFAKLKYDQDTSKEDIVSKFAKDAAEKKEKAGFKFPWDN